VLIVLFALALVALAGATARLAGWMTLISAGVISALWWLAAAGTLLTRTREPSPAGLPSGAAA
jgi:hypothetical protein